MAKIIKTGEVVAIDLKRLRSKEILCLDDEIDATITGKRPNGGFLKALLEWRNGVLGLMEFVKTFKPEK